MSLALGHGIGVPYTNLTGLGGSFSFPVFAPAQSMQMLMGSPNASAEIKDMLYGVGVGTYAVPAGMLLPDFEGLYKPAELNTIPLVGSRKVTNLISDSNAFNAGTLIDGWYLHAATNGRVFSAISVPVVEGREYVARIDVRNFSGGTSRPVFSSSAIAITDQIFPEPTVDGPYRISFTADATGNLQLRLGIGTTNNDTGSIELRNLQVEDTTGQTNQNPSEYIPTTSAPVTKHFSESNGNTVASNIVTEARGTPFTVHPSLYGAPAYTNVMPYSSDLTNWTIRNAGTATYDQVGLTGAPNTASEVTVGTGATDDVYLYLSGGGASVSYTVRVFIKAITTTSTTLLVQNPNASGDGQWEVDLSAISTTEFEEITEDHAAVTVINAFVTASSGAYGLHFRDVSEVASFVVGNAEIYLNKTIAEVRGSLPLQTSGAAVTSAAVSISYDVANHSDTRGAYYCEFTSPIDDGDAGDDARIGMVTVSVVGQTALLYSQYGDRIRSYDGTNIVEAPITALVSGTRYQVGLAYSADELLSTIYLDAVGNEGLYDGAYPQSNGLLLGSTNKFITLTSNVRRYDLAYTAAKAKIDELML